MPPIQLEALCFDWTSSSYLPVPTSLHYRKLSMGETILEIGAEQSATIPFKAGKAGYTRIPISIPFMRQEIRDYEIAVNEFLAQAHTEAAPGASTQAIANLPTMTKDLAPASLAFISQTGNHHERILAIVLHSQGTTPEYFDEQNAKRLEEALRRFGAN